jgi:predicted outer membrane repeat protein
VLPESFAAHAVEVRLRSNSSSNSSAHGGGALFCVESARLKQELFTLLAGCVQLEHER